MVLNFFRPLAFFVILWTMYRPYANKALFIKTTLHPAADYTTAHRTCLRHNMSMVFPDHFLSTTEAEEEQFWLPIRRNGSMPWTWLDGTPYVGTNIGSRHNCALIRPKDKFIDAADCHRRRYGFICFHSTFSEGNCRGNDRCIKVKDAEVDVHPGPVTWYEAANLCRQLGTQLFFFNSSHQQEVLDVISTKASRPAWIGLRQQDFVGLDKRLYNWNLQGQDRDANCAVVSFRSHLWKTAKCSSFHRFVCQRSVAESVAECTTLGTVPSTSTATSTTPARTTRPRSTTAESRLVTNKEDCIWKVQTCQCPLPSRTSPLPTVTSNPQVQTALKISEGKDTGTKKPESSGGNKLELDKLHIILIFSLVAVLLLVVIILAVAVFRMVRSTAQAGAAGGTGYNMVPLDSPQA